MPGGAYSALSGMQTRLDELDRLAADLANVGTAGYKTERTGSVAAERQAFSTALDSAVDVDDAAATQDRLPSRHDRHDRPRPRRRDRRHGLLRRRDAGRRCATRATAVRRRSADGVLTTARRRAGASATSGADHAAARRPVTIDDDGTVRVGGAVVGQDSQSCEFESERRPDARIGLALPRDAGADAAAGGRHALVGGALEQSNVSVVDRMAELTEVTRTFEACNAVCRC